MRRMQASKHRSSRKSDQCTESNDRKKSIKVGMVVRNTGRLYACHTTSERIISKERF